MMRPRLPRFQFGEVQIGTVVFGLMLLPVSAVIAALEAFVPRAEIQRVVTANHELAGTPSLDLYVFYLTAAVAHIIVSVLVIAFLKRGLQADISATKEKAIRSSVRLASGVLIGLFLLVDYLQPALAQLSHGRVYAVLQNSSLFSPYFVTPIPAFHLFSLLPAGLIVLGLVVIVLTCFSVGRDLMFVSHSIRSGPTADKRNDIDLKIRSFHNYFYVLSSVLATSTIATTLFLKLPLTSMAPGTGYDSFDALSNAMSVCWGVTFSLTMLAMCFYPYFRVQRDLRVLINDAKVSEDIELQRWVADIQANYVIYTNVKSLISIFVPTAIGAMSPFV